MAEMNEGLHHEPRARHACEPCRRKKTKCPGEKPICSFCQRLNQRCTYLQNDGNSRPMKSRRDSKERLRRLEAQMERMSGEIETLLSQRRPTQIELETSIPQPQRQSTYSDPSTLSQSSNTFFDASCSPDPPPEALNFFVETYKNRLHTQPLPLFNLEALSAQIIGFPQYLLRSFLTATLLFSDHQFFGNSKADALEFYTRSSREATISLATDGVPSIEIIQSLCLLVLSDIAIGKQARAWMTISIASRLAIIYQSGYSENQSPSLVQENKSRCCWSVFVLERAFALGPYMLQSASMNIDYPPSPSKPATTTGSNMSTIPSLAPSNATNDLGINAYCLQLISIWGNVATYMRQARAGNVEDPWIASSAHHTLMAEFHQFECSLAQVHRFKNVGFQTRTCEELIHDKLYWTPWLLLQITFHTGQALLHHPVFHIVTTRKSNTTYKPPSFLQHSVDQALLHSGWTARFISMCASLGYEISDPFIGHLVVVTATIHWIFSFASDEAVAERARSDFNYCQRFIHGLVGKWPHFFQSKANGLDTLQSLARESCGTAGHHGISSLKLSLIWDLLDPNSIIPSSDTSCHGISPDGRRITTQYLAPLRESSSNHEAELVENRLGHELESSPASPTNVLPDYLMNDDLFGQVQIPDLSQLHFQPYLNFHGEL